MANETESTAKKRILVIGDSELKNVLYSVNGGLRNYQLVGLPCVTGSTEKRVENELSAGDYSGILIDELYPEFVPKIKHKGNKYGIIRWSDYYAGKMKKIMEENKTVRFGAETPEDIEKELDKMFA